MMEMEREKDQGVVQVSPESNRCKGNEVLLQRPNIYCVRMGG
jgi:hypothetical protein